MWQRPLVIIIWLIILPLGLPLEQPLSLVLGFPLVPQISFAAETSIGPTSRTEAEFLWKSGSISVEQKKYAQAVPMLQRYVDRYPGYPHTLEAQTLLARALAATGRQKEAVPLFQDAIRITANPAQLLQLKIWLSEVYLQLKNYSDAYAVSNEISLLLANEQNPEQRPGKTSTPQTNSSEHFDSALILQSILLRARALIGRQEFALASQWLSASVKHQPWDKHPDLAHDRSDLELQCHLHACTEITKAEYSDEFQARTQLSQRGLCLVQGAALFKESHSDLTQPLLQAFQNYVELCQHPKLKSNPTITRTADQWKQYRLELLDRLRQDCTQHIQSAIDLWSGADSKTQSSIIRQFLHHLTQLTARTSWHLAPHPTPSN